MLAGVKRWYARRQLKSLLDEQRKRNTPMWIWLLENKRIVSLGLTLVYGAVATAFPENQGVQNTLQVVVPLLIGAGFLPSDLEQRSRRQRREGLRTRSTD